MESLSELAGMFNSERMKFAHAVIIMIYGILVSAVVGPYFGLILFPPEKPIEWDRILSHYWQQKAGDSALGSVVYLVFAINAGILLYAFQVPTNRYYARWFVNWVAIHIFGLGDDVRLVEEKSVSSRRFKDKGMYASFLEYVEEQPIKFRIRSWDWFMTNAIRTLGFVLLLFGMCNVLLGLAILLGYSQVIEANHAAVWIITPLALMVLLVPADVKHYRVRAEADWRTLEEFAERNDREVSQIIK